MGHWVSRANNLATHSDLLNHSTPNAMTTAQLQALSLDELKRHREQCLNDMMLAPTEEGAEYYAVLWSAAIAEYKHRRRSAGGETSGRLR